MRHSKMRMSHLRGVEAQKVKGGRLTLWGLAMFERLGRMECRPEM